MCPDTTRCTVTHHKCVAMGSLLRLMVCQRHSVRKVDIDVAVHVLDQDVAVVVSVPSDFLLR